MNRLFPAAWITLLAMVGCNAAQPRLKPTSQPSDLVALRYDISDLMFVPIDGDSRLPDLTAPQSNESSSLFSDGTPAAACDHKHRIEELRQYIRENVEPSSWNSTTGIDATQAERRTVLRITQTRSAHQEVTALLNHLARQLDMQVRVELRFLALDDQLEQKLTPEVQHRLASVRNTGRTRRDVFLSAAQVKQMAEVIEGPVHINSLGPPTLTLFSGQHANLIVQTQQAYIADFHPSTTQPSVLEPDIRTTTATGITTRVCAVVAPDHATVFLDIQATAGRLLALQPERFHTDPSATIQRPIYATNRCTAAFTVDNDSTAVLGWESAVQSGDTAFNSDSPSRPGTLAAVQKLTEENSHTHFYLLVRPTIHYQPAKPIEAQPDF